MLWWMLERSNQLLPSPELNAVVQEYRRLHGARYISSPWSYLITGQKPILTEPFAFVDQLPDYNVQFIYGFSCDRKLAEQPIVQRQNNTSFCWRYHPISPACITHQMMGFRFMERARCNAMPDLRDKLDTLSGTARWQSRLDFRVVDVYLQRVVMQIDSGFADRVNPRWLKRILREQGDDGGWDDFQSLLPLGSEKAIGFSGRGFKIGDTSSNFHATAQGIWLMSYLLGKPSTFQSVMQ
ncbi:hypothetical protein GYB62_02895 [bacterium]|nr:hypothetical protein [bacterium]